MKITDVKTLLLDAYRTNWAFIKVETDEGLYGFGEASLAFEFDEAVNFDLEYVKWFAGKGDHGGRGAILELFGGDGQLYISDDLDGTPLGPPERREAQFYPGRHRVTIRVRSDLYVPPGHFCGVRLRLLKK